ncbi:MAG TPA: hypothetical protein VF950_11970 [Planctomycetota bacterium]
MAKNDEQRAQAVDLFNSVWKLLDKKKRTREEDDAMLHAAHASRHHWGQVGTPLNFARGEWQVSRVYAVLKRAEPALHHAKRCLELCREHKIGDFDLAYAYEALARASALAKKKGDVARYLKLAAKAAAGISKKEDREFFEKDLATL